MSKDNTAVPAQLGRYKLLRVIGAGGMGNVYLARFGGEGGFSRLVALKLLPPHLKGDGSYIDMFLDEGHLGGRISHPNVAAVLDVGREEDWYYIALELVLGPSLRSAINRAYSKRLTIAPDLCCHIVSKLCRGVHAAHEAKASNGEALGMVHRDISPRNVLLTFDGGVKLIDFGVAWARLRFAETQAGIIKGKASYMSPEQIATGSVDRRSDVFSLGIVLSEILSGANPFAGNSTTESMSKILSGEFDRSRLDKIGVNDEIIDIVFKALAKEPGNRFFAAAEMADSLEAAAGFVGEQGRKPLAGLIRSLFGQAQSVMEREAILLSTNPPASMDRRLSTEIKAYDWFTETLGNSAVDGHPGSYEEEDTEPEDFGETRAE